MEIRKEGRMGSEGGRGGRWVGWVHVSLFV